MTSNYQKKIDFVKSISNQLEGTRRFEYVIISKGEDVYEELYKTVANPQGLFEKNTFKVLSNSKEPICIFL